MTSSLHRRITDLAIALALLLIAALVTWTAYSYTRSSGLFPIFTGWLFLVLVAIEVWVQLRKLRHPAADASPPDTPEASRAGPLHELRGPAWLGFLLAAIYVAGFLVAIPMFLFLFLLLAAKRRAAYSAIVAVALTACVYFVFAWLLEYRLFGGVLFGG